MESNKEIFDRLKKGDKVYMTYGDAIKRSNEATLLVKSKNLVGKGKSFQSEKITFENVNNPTGVKYYAYKRSNDFVGFAVGDMAISNVVIKIESKMADGGNIKGLNTKTGVKFGVVIGSQKKSDEYVENGTELNVRSSYSSRISEVKLIFDGDSNLYEVIDYGYSLDGVPSTGAGQSHTYSADKKETLHILSEMFSPSFARKLIDSISTKMAKGGGVEKKDSYIVEIRVHDEDGDYTEQDYEFDNKKDAFAFAKKNGNVHEIYYYPAGTDSNPKRLLERGGSMAKGGGVGQSNFGKEGTGFDNPKYKNMYGGSYDDNGLALKPTNDITTLGSKLIVTKESNGSFRWDLILENGNKFKTKSGFNTKQDAINDYMRTKFAKGGEVGRTITRVIQYANGGQAGLVDEEQMKDLSFKIKAKTLPNEKGVLLHELITIEEFELYNDLDNNGTIKFYPFHLIYGNSSLAIFDAFGVDEVAGLKRKDCEDFINELKKEGKTEKDGAFIAGLTNYVGDKLFMFFNVERLNFKGFAIRVLPHESLHLSRSLISLFKNDWVRNNLNKPNWWEDKRATFVEMGDSNEEFFAETLERTTAIAMDGWSRVTGFQYAQGGGVENTEGGDWRKGSSIHYKTKKEASDRLKLLKNYPNEYKNLRIIKTDAYNPYSVHFEFLKNVDNYAQGGGVEEIKTLWRIKGDDAELIKKGTAKSIKMFLNKEQKKNWRGEKSIFDGGAGVESWYENTTKEEVLKYHRGRSSTNQEYAQGGTVSAQYRLVPYKERMQGFIESVGEKQLSLEGTFNDAVLSAESLLSSDSDFVYVQITKLGKNVMSAKKVAIVSADGVVKYGDGGTLEEENSDMVRSQNKAISHHTEELEEQLDKGKKTPAWVVSKVSRASNDLSDVTHYLEGEKMAEGGEVSKEYRIASKYAKMLNDIAKEKQFNKRIQLNDEMKKFAKENGLSIDNNNIISVNGVRVAYIDKINQRTSQSKTNWAIHQMAQGGGVDGKAYFIVKFSFNGDDGYQVVNSKPIHAQNENEAAAMLKDQFESLEGMSCEIISVKNQSKMAQGGGVEIIKNQYSGKSAKEVYELWDYGQKYEFFKDHFQNAGIYSHSDYKRLPSKKYDELDEISKNALITHIKDGQYAKGGGVEKMMINSFDVSQLVGKWLTFVGYGEHDLQITHARVTPEHFSQRDLFLTTSGGGTEKIPFAQAQDFINGKAVELRDSKGEYFTLKLVSPMFAKGGLTESQQNKFDKVMQEYKKGELHSGKTERVVTDKKQAVAIAFAQANKLAMGGYINQEPDKIIGVQRTEQTDVFINSDIYRTEADYIIGGFSTYQLNKIAVDNDITVLSMPKLKHLIKKRIEAAIESLKSEISSTAISSESQFNSYEVNQDYNNEIVNLFETYLECRPESINTSKLAEQIMNDSAFMVWESRIEERMMKMKSQIRYQYNDVNKLKDSNISVKEAEDLTYSATLEQMLEQLRNIIEVNEN